MSVSLLGLPMGTGGVNKAVYLGKGGFSVVRRLVGFHLGKLKGQLTFGQRHISALVAVDDRNRLAPITLAGEHPSHTV